MKRTPSALARTLERPAVIAPPPLQVETVRNLERWFTRAVLLALAALTIAILVA